MKPVQKVLVALLAGNFLLASCGQITETTDNRQQATESVLAIASSSASTPLPTLPSPSPTEVTCDPITAEFCVGGEANLILQRPIAPSGGDSVDRTYPYASTAGGTREPHHGVEFPNPSGTPVLAAADGTVFFAGDDTSTRFGPWSNFYGNLVVLEHPLPGRTLFTLYAHLSLVNVAIRQTVHAGDEIGEVGATGAAIGSHLHFEVRTSPLDYNSTLNPELWLVPRPGTGILSVRLLDHAGNFISIPLSLQYFPDANETFSKAWEINIYQVGVTPSNSWENAAMGDLIEGHYRITFLWEGTWQERWIELENGKVTFVEFIVTP